MAKDMEQCVFRFGFLFQDKVPAEVVFPYNRIGGQLLRRTMKKDFSFKKQVSAVGNLQGFIYVMICDENADILIFQTPYHILNFLYGDGVNAGEGLIEHYESRLNC